MLISQAYMYIRDRESVVLDMPKAPYIHKAYNSPNAAFLFRNWDMYM